MYELQFGNRDWGARPHTYPWIESYRIAADFHAVLFSSKIKFVELYKVASTDAGSQNLGHTPMRKNIYNYGRPILCRDIK